MNVLLTILGCVDPWVIVLTVFSPPAVYIYHHCCLGHVRLWIRMARHVISTCGTAAHSHMHNQNLVIVKNIANMGCFRPWAIFLIMDNLIQLASFIRFAFFIKMCYRVFQALQLIVFVPFIDVDYTLASCMQLQFGNLALNDSWSVIVAYWRFILDLLLSYTYIHTF